MDDLDVKAEFEKSDRTRNMGYTLQFLLTVEISLASVTYYFTSASETHQRILDVFYLIWMLALTFSLIPMALTTPLVFAKIRALFRLAHLTAIIVTYCYFRFTLAPPLLIDYFLCEFGYLMHGIYYQQMDWPGKWMAEVTDKWQEWKSGQQDKNRTRTANMVLSTV